MKKITLLFIAVLFSSFSLLAQTNSEIKIINRSQWDVDNIYISSVDTQTWGEDLLGSDEILAPGESIIIVADCDVYDVKLVDEDDIVCILENVTICNEDGTWLIGDLTNCKQE